MARDTVTFRIETEKKEAVDALAGVLDRDRSYILNEAISAYLDTHRWHLEHIREGLREAKAGRFATKRQVKRALARWRK